MIALWNIEAVTIFKALDESREAAGFSNVQLSTRLGENHAKVMKNISEGAKGKHEPSLGTILKMSSAMGAKLCLIDYGGGVHPVSKEGCDLTVKDSLYIERLKRCIEATEAKLEKLKGELERHSQVEAGGPEEWA